MSDQATPRLHADTYVEGEDFVDSDTITADLDMALEAARQRRQKSGKIRTTIYGEEGCRIGPEMMTGEERRAHIATLDTSSSGHLTYDAEADALFIHLRDTAKVASRELEPGLVINYDADGNVIGVELREASQRIPRPQEEAA